MVDGFSVSKIQNFANEKYFSVSFIQQLITSCLQMPWHLHAEMCICKGRGGGGGEICSICIHIAMVFFLVWQ
jgi:hypothetical protein